MSSWISSLRLGRFRQGISFGPEDFRSRSPRPVIVTEQQTDPVDLLYCESAWNKDPVFGVIGIQSEPRG